MRIRQHWFVWANLLKFLLGVVDRDDLGRDCDHVH